MEAENWWSHLEWRRGSSSVVFLGESHWNNLQKGSETLLGSSCVVQKMEEVEPMTECDQAGMDVLDTRNRITLQHWAIKDKKST